VKDNVVPCSDSAGVVAAVGDAVEDISVGDRVVANFDRSNLYGPQKDWVHSLGGFFDGTLRQYIAVPAIAVAKIPETCELSFTQLASLICTGVTAWNALFGCIPLQPGQTVLFLGKIFCFPLFAVSSRVSVAHILCFVLLSFWLDRHGHNYQAPEVFPSRVFSSPRLQAPSRSSRRPRTRSSSS
jgi:hypothetical protein